MAFKVKPSKALEVATNLVEAEILRLSNLRRTWTTEELVEYFGERHVVFSLDEMTRINDQLHARDIVEDVDVEDVE